MCGGLTFSPLGGQPGPGGANMITMTPVHSQPVRGVGDAAVNEGAMWVGWGVSRGVDTSSSKGRWVPNAAAGRANRARLAALAAVPSLTGAGKAQGAPVCAGQETDGWEKRRVGHVCVTSEAEGRGAWRGAQAQGGITSHPHRVRPVGSRVRVGGQACRRSRAFGGERWFNGEIRPASCASETLRPHTMSSTCLKGRYVTMAMLALFLKRLRF